MFSFRQPQISLFLLHQFSKFSPEEQRDILIELHDILLSHRHDVIEEQEGIMAAQSNKIEGRNEIIQVLHQQKQEVLQSVLGILGDNYQSSEEFLERLRELILYLNQQIESKEAA
jgi:hypothetical protein